MKTRELFGYAFQIGRSKRIHALAAFVHPCMVQPVYSSPKLT